MGESVQLEGIVVSVACGEGRCKACTGSDTQAYLIPETVEDSLRWAMGPGIVGFPFPVGLFTCGCPCHEGQV